ncbi:ABC transporter ATP-binding protein [Phreatobacter aquaticus]|uniref:ABC transporter ATP-binding protein n=1 Tax=Phreatobacter aquaticus TaxID=2570229 RepID=A0A4D7QJ54_9HYPH|nr:ABC transporter ATP-binding protein [Phreatobacter aquaticus]QCK85913.1 ABC transporter ATP-binding protein [Phreatobacter aquaticus]
MPGIVLDRIEKSFGETRVLKGVSLAFDAGSFVSLVGPSGCGKTTLLRIIAGLEQADRGTVTIAGRAVSGMRAADRDVAMVFQNYALYPHLTVEQNMALPLVMRRLSTLERTPFIGRLVSGTDQRRSAIRAEVEEAARLLSIDHLMERRPGQLSGGQRQRVALGRAIVRHPKAFLMDEPLSNLDAALRHDMRRELVELHRRVGVTTVYVTHDQAEAMTMSDRVAVMLGGNVLQFGSPREVYDQPATIDVARFIGSPRINILPAEIGPEGQVMIAGHATGQVGPRSGGKLDIGIRPEHLTVGEIGFAVDVRHVEFLGSEVLVYAREPRQGSDIILRLAPEAWESAPSRQVLRVTPMAGRMLAFDTSGKRVELVAAGIQAAVPASERDIIPRVPRYV